ncbi:MAG: preprotein translocase subunit SecY [Alphaproteobacteria bacterium]|jgi:preprotein translocase subunit SecY
MVNSSNVASQFDFSVFGRAKELKKRIVFALLCLVVYRLGTYIPIPGIDSQVLKSAFASHSGGVLGMFNMFSGGALGRMTIFALSIMPYITVSIIMQLLTVISPKLAALKKEGESGRQKIIQYTRYGTVIMCSFQAYGISSFLLNLNGTHSNLIVVSPSVFQLTTIFTLVGGTMFLMWLGEQITQRGIGNGTSLIIFTGIVAEFPRAIINTFELSKTGAISPIVILMVLILAIGLIALIVFFEKAQRKIIVQYPKRNVGNKVYGAENSHLPLKINQAGVIPPIFASSLLLFPTTIAGFGAGKDSNGYFANVVDFLTLHLAHGKPLYILLFIALIMFFCFFYAKNVFNPNETAEMLKKNGGFIPGIRPGANTAEFLSKITTKLTFIGAIYLSVICVIPEILISKFNMPFYLGGTSLLIVVNVVIDTMTQIQSHLFAHQYENLLKKAKLKGLRR